MPHTMTARSASDLRLLDRAQKATGLAHGLFATRVLLRDVSTVRRWRAGDRPVPAVVRRRLEAIVRRKTCPWCLGTGEIVSLPKKAAG